MADVFIQVNVKLPWSTDSQPEWLFLERLCGVPDVAIAAGALHWKTHKLIQPSYDVESDRWTTETEVIPPDWWSEAVWAKEIADWAECDWITTEEAEKVLEKFRGYWLKKGTE